MLRILLIASLLIVRIYASNFDWSDNYIDYRDGPIKGYEVPYAYQPHKVTVNKVSPYMDDSRGHVLVPAELEHKVTEVEDSKSVFDASVLSSQVTFGVIRNAAVYLFHKIPVLLIGTLIALGVCNFTPLCGKLSAIESLEEIKRGIRSLASSEQVAEATEFVQNAIRKYRSLQDAE